MEDSEYIQICKFLVEMKHCHATHRNDALKISVPFLLRIKPDANLQTQRPNKVPLQYRDNLNIFLDDLQKNGVLKQIGSTPHEKPNCGNIFLNPYVFIKKSDSIKTVLDARHLNTNIDQSSESCPLELLATQLPGENKKYKSAIDLMYAYAHATLLDEAGKLTGFLPGDTFLAFIKRLFLLQKSSLFFHTTDISVFQRLDPSRIHSGFY